MGRPGFEVSKTLAGKSFFSVNWTERSQRSEPECAEKNLCKFAKRTQNRNWGMAPDNRA
jgi:hypothetical protein